MIVYTLYIPIEHTVNILTNNRTKHDLLICFSLKSITYKIIENTLNNLKVSMSNDLLIIPIR